MTVARDEDPAVFGITVTSYSDTTHLYCVGASMPRTPFDSYSQPLNRPTPAYTRCRRFLNGQHINLNGSS